jgi:N-acetylmuramoyl-L-alanine amidase
MSNIVIDPGHGGTTATGNSSANNAKGPKGTLEKNITLSIAVKTAEILNQAGHSVVLTRNNDTNLGLSDRAKVAAKNNAEVFVSIHFNGDNNASVQGTECWVHPAATQDSRLLASSLLQRLVQVAGYTNRGVKAGKLGVLSPAVHAISTATCLIEISFITNAADETRLLTSAYQSQLANGISRAITDFINKATSITPLNPIPSNVLAIDGDI